MKQVFCSIVILLLFLSSCAQINPDNHSQAFEVQISETSNLIDTILDNQELSPGENLYWLMSKDNFLINIYGAETLDPDSEKYEEYRIGRMENGFLSFSPPTAIRIKKSDLLATTTYLFNEKEELVKVAYRAQCSDKEIGTYSELLNELIAEINASEVLIGDNSEFLNISETDLLENPVTLRWEHADGNTYFQMNSVHFEENMLLDLILSILNP